MSSPVAGLIVAIAMLSSSRAGRKGFLRLNSYLDSFNQTTTSSFEPEFIARPDLWCRNTKIIALSFRRVVDLRRPARFLKPLMRILPGGRLRRLLSPMYDGNFVTPLGQTSHNLAVDPGKHIRPHCLFGIPDGARPKRVVSVAENGDAERTLRGFGLSRRAISLHEKRGKIAPGTHAQAGEGYEEHDFSILTQVRTPCLPPRTGSCNSAKVRV